jgi:hypothetical protein
MTRVWWYHRVESQGRVVVSQGGNIRTWGGGPRGRREVSDACLSLGNKEVLSHVGGQLSGLWQLTPDALLSTTWTGEMQQGWWLLQSDLLCLQYTGYSGQAPQRLPGSWYPPVALNWLLL